MIGNDDLVVDLFAGGGGTSRAFEEAIGRSPDIAINHDPKAPRLRWVVLTARTAILSTRQLVSRKSR